MLSKRTRIILLLVVIFPPAMGLALVTAMGWLQFEWSLNGILLVLGAYAGWIAILAGLAEFTGFFRHATAPTPETTEPARVPPQAEVPAVTKDPPDVPSSRAPQAHKARVKGSGAIAQDHSVAAGAGGTAVGESVHGDIQVSGRDKEKGE